MSGFIVGQNCVDTERSVTGQIHQITLNGDVMWVMLETGGKWTPICPVGSELLYRERIVPSDVLIFPTSPPRKLKHGWSVFEGGEPEYQRHLIEQEGRERLNAYLHRNHPSRRIEADIAEAVKADQGPWKLGLGSLPQLNKVLPHLWGQPWNNEAINDLTSLRPTAVTVMNEQWREYTDDQTRIMMTPHRMPYEVYVYLASDDRTIVEIDQNVLLGSLGYGSYEDVSEQTSNTMLTDDSLD